MTKTVEYVGDEKHHDALVKVQLAQKRGQGEVPTNPRRPLPDIDYAKRKESGRQKAGGR